MMQDMIGPQGVSREEIVIMESCVAKAAKSLEDKRGQMVWRDLPYSQDDVVEEIVKTASDINNDFDHFVLLGIGGSALGPLAVHRAMNPTYYNELSKEDRKGPKIFIEDNIDPDRIKSLLDVLDLKRTVFCVISKSGATAETMAQTMIISQMLKEIYNGDIGKHFIMITDQEKGNLNIIAKEENCKTLHIPRGVGGRFSQLSPVGLLPAAVCGIDIKMLLKGAASMDKQCESEDVWKNPAAMGALLQVQYMKKGRNISVMMPYIDGFRYIADWYAQLWAESLGKRIDNDGYVVFSGQTPVKSLGVTDQHSQLQLYVEGPHDKVITFIRTDKFRNDFTIPNAYPDIDDISFLGGHTLSELVNVEQESTEFALYKAGRPSQTIYLPEISEYTLGQLLYFFELETAFVGELLNINAFDQPGVEESKNAAYAVLGKAGFEEKRKELSEKEKLNNALQF